MKKKLVRLTESDLHRIVENSVTRIIREKEEYIQGNLFGDDSEYGEPKGAFEKKEADKRKKKEASKKRAETRKERKANKEKEERNEFIRNHQLPFKESRNLHNIVEDSVKRVIKEIGDTPRGQEALGALKARQEEDLCDIDLENDFDNWSKNANNGFKTQLHAVNADKERRMGSLTDKEHPFNKGYYKYLKNRNPERAKGLSKYFE